VLAKRIIPCLDVKDGRVVKGVNFINLKDAGDPVETAAVYAREGADEIVFLDITASVEKRRAILEVVKQTAEKVFIPLTVGGGIRNLEDIRLLLRSGADKVSINTAAVEDISLVKEAARAFGSQCIVVAIDAKKTVGQLPSYPVTRLGTGKPANRQTGEPSWEVYTYGGRKSSGINAIEWAIKAEKSGAGEILLTSMDKDGTKEGYDLKLTRTVSESVNIPVIASGGAGNLEHLYSAFKEGCADAVLAASIFHYGEYSIQEAKGYLRQRGITMRE